MTEISPFILCSPVQYHGQEPTRRHLLLIYIYNCGNTKSRCYRDRTGIEGHYSNSSDQLRPPCLAVQDSSSHDPLVASLYEYASIMSCWRGSIPARGNQLGGVTVSPILVTLEAFKNIRRVRAGRGPAKVGRRTS
jgi:hypothetical protein